MQALAIVNLFEEFTDVAACMFGIVIEAAIHFLRLERFHEALGLGVIVRVGNAAHAGPDTVGIEDVGVVAAGVLRAAVGDRNYLVS